MKLLVFAIACFSVVFADVNHIASNEYLPPIQDVSPVVAPESNYIVDVSSALPVQEETALAPAHILADDGYRYKTHRRVVYRRNRRDVSHLPSNDYLPPVHEAPIAVPTNDYLPPVQQSISYSAPVEAPPAHILADDGYRYKTHRRVVYRRNRRDVSHLPSNDYLPPVQEAPIAVPTNDYLPPVQQSPLISYSAAVEAPPAHILADDGYRYKTHRRVVYRRNRRDVSHLPSNDYLPPVQEAPIAVPTNDYLPPVQQSISYSAPVEAPPAHILGDDGYRYKTHRRVVYRRQ